MKPHVLLKNSALDLRESNGPVEWSLIKIVSSAMGVYPSKVQPALITKSSLRLGIIADRKVKPISVKNLMVVVLEDCE